MEDGAGSRPSLAFLRPDPSSILYPPSSFSLPHHTMTRRIALAILLTVWAVLVAGCVVAYATVRWALIEQLDQSLVNKASALPELMRVPAGAATRPAPTPDPRVDRYVITDQNGVLVSP